MASEKTVSGTQDSPAVAVPAGAVQQAGEASALPASDLPAADLPRVGALAGDDGAAATGDASIPGDGGEKSSRWWSDARGPLRSENSGRQRGWTTSAGEEMEKFRRLPVVGRLPWRIQYAIALGFLAISLVVLIALSVLLARQGDLVAREASAGLVLHQTLQSLGSSRPGQADMADVSRVPVLVSQGTQAIEQLASLAIPGQAGAIADLKGQWAALGTAVSGQADIARAAQAVSLAAMDIRSQLGDLIPRMQAAAEQAGAPSPGLSQVLSDLGDWYETTTQMASQGALVPDRIVLERQRIEQLLRAFAAQPDHAQSPELGAWQVLATAWPTLQPRLDSVLVQRDSWAAVRSGAQALRAKADVVSQTLNGLTATSLAWQANQGHLRNAAWFVGGLAGLAMCLFMVIAWKQQRYRMLESLNHQEQTERALQEFVEDIREIANGNLTRRPRVSATSVGVVADTLGKAIDVLRRLISRVKKSVEKTSEASTRASTATVALVDGAQLGASAQAEQLPLIQAIARQAHDLATSFSGTAGRAQSAAAAAASGVGDAEAMREGFQQARAAMEEARSRADRLASGTADHNRALSSLGDLAEEAKVLSVQVSIQASKLGERGQGLQRVSDGISQLATRLEPLAHKALVQARSLQSDGEGVSRQLDGAGTVLVEGSRRSDACSATVVALRASLVALAREVSGIVEQVAGQDDAARQLDAMARQSATRLALAPQEAEIAAGAVSELIQVSQDLGASVERFRV